MRIFGVVERSQKIYVKTHSATKKSISKHLPKNIFKLLKYCSTINKFSNKRIEQLKIVLG